jgi:hypothetical protein
MQQRGRLQNDRRAQDACPADEPRAQTGDDPIPGLPVRRTFYGRDSGSELMPDQDRFSDHAAKLAGPRQSHDSDDQMKQNNEEVTHPDAHCPARIGVSLTGIINGFLGRQRTFERYTVDVLYDKIIRSQVVKLTDVRVIQRRDCMGFALEAGAEPHRGDFDRDGAVKACMTRFPYLAHAERISSGPRRSVAFIPRLRGAHHCPAPRTLRANSCYDPDRDFRNARALQNVRPDQDCLSSRDDRT